MPHITRLDIASAVNLLRFMHEPGKPYMDATFRVLKYLKGLPGR